MKNRKTWTLLALSLLTGCTLAACSNDSGKTPSQTTEDKTLVLTAEASELYIDDTTTITVKCRSETISDVIFESSDETIATISTAGVVKGLKVGSVTIKAKKAGYKAGTIAITVKEREKEATTAVLEFENAQHYTPNGMWGDSYNGYTHDSPIETTENASGGKAVGYQVLGCKETLTFTSDKAGSVRMGFVMASTAADWTGYPNVKIGEMTLSQVITVTVNGTAVDLGDKKLSGTDGQNYYNFMEVQYSNIAVQTGENKVIVETKGSQGPNMDCVNLYAEGYQLAEVIKESPKTTEVGTYDYYVNGYEWGPAVSRAVIHLNSGYSVAASVLEDNSLFTVRSGSSTLTVSDLYLVDENGNKTNDATGAHIGLDFALNVTSEYVDYSAYGWGAWWSVIANGLSPFNYDNATARNVWNDSYALKFTLTSGKSLTLGDKTYNDDAPMQVSTLGKKVIEATKDWSEAKTHTLSSDSTKTLSYKAFEPSALKADSGKNPLIIWLHGQGEGGTDPDIALLGNDVTNLGETKIQSYFKSSTSNGAYVLAVQTPTMWMDDGTGTNNQGLAHSIYTAALKETIDTYISSNSDVDTSKIYLGGCSNGGYMTMEMALTYGSTGFFKGYFPVCEAYADSFISDTDIATLKNLNMWITLSANDKTVNPETFSLATYRRLMTAGASNIHLSYFEKVVGNDSGKENEYDGHWSWIYLFHDEVKKDQADYNTIAAPSTKDVTVDGKAVGIWEWLSLLS